jgi:NitT/TauT family transport system ATP-binding protein
LIAGEERSTPAGETAIAVPKLTIRDLHKYYSIDEGFGRTTRVHALKDINLDAYDGELLTIIGPSGCGKTTLLMAIAGIHSIDGGTIILDGRPVHEPGLDRGIVFQDFALFPWMTVATQQRRPLGRRAARDHGEVSQTGRPAGLCGYLSTPPVRRHETARRNRSRVSARPCNPADG